MEMDFKEAHFDENFIKPCGKASKLLLPFNSQNNKQQQILQQQNQTNKEKEKI